MAALIRSLLPHVNVEISRTLSPRVIEDICRELKHSWRRCTLDPAKTVYAFLRQILESNTPRDRVPHLMGLDVTGEEYCNSSSRLSVKSAPPRTPCRAYMRTMMSGISKLE